MSKQQMPCAQSASPLPEHGICFVCGTENEKGMGLVWCVQKTQAPQQEDEPLPPGAVRIYAEFEFDEAQQGPPGHAHGGASAAVIDEAMGAVVWQSGLRALLANLNLDYRLPVPLHTPVRAEAWLERMEGRKAYARGQILVGGKVAVEGSGLFVHIPAFFSDYDQ